MTLLKLGVGVAVAATFFICWLLRNHGPHINYEPIIDLGVHDFGEHVPFIAKFQNLGDSRLILSHFQVSCLCLAPNFTKELDLEPGQSTTISGELQLPEQNIHLSQHVAFRTNDRHSPVGKITLNARVEKQVTFMPDSLVFSPGDCASFPVSKKTILEVGRSIEVITSVSLEVPVAYAEARVVHQFPHKSEIELIIGSQCPSGEIDEKITVRFESGGVSRSKEIRFGGVFRNQTIAAPSFLALGRADLNHSIEVHCKPPENLLDCTVSCSASSAATKIECSLNADGVIKITPRSLPSPKNFGGARICVTKNGTGAPVLNVPVYCIDRT